jgi:Tol biopolymer transport system component
VAYLTGIEGRGSIWTANADGGGAKQLVADALHSELVWSPAGDQLFFTRLLTETQGYDLYRVKADGSQPPVRVGPSRIPSPESAAAWRNHIAWSPNGLLMLFQGSDQQGRVTVYVALADGSDPRIVIESLPDDTAAFWSPTNRGILVATGQAMKLYWVDSERNPLTFPSGRTPSWQP